MAVVEQQLFQGVAGQARAVEQLTAALKRPSHAYLLVGPSGSGTRAAGVAFAAGLLCPHGGDGSCESCALALRERHPDLVIVERSGASINVGQAREIVRLAARSASNGSRKVLLLTDFHLVEEAAPALLKTIEEPPEGTFFVILAEQVPVELVTIASRCCRIDFGSIPESVIAEQLVKDGISAEDARDLALVANGDLDRARLLAADPKHGERRQMWLSVSSSLDGTGATVARLADELLASIESVVEPVAARHEKELVAWKERAKETGERATARKELEDRHKREQRRVRTDEFRFGLLTLAEVERDRLASASASRDAAKALARLDALQEATEALVRNPNETLLLQSLLLKL